MKTQNLVEMRSNTFEHNVTGHWHERSDIILLRNPALGIVNGYIRVPDDHPWRELLSCDGGYVRIMENVSELVRNNEEAFEIDAMLEGGARELTFSEDSGWVGFDTGNFFDMWPGTQLLSTENGVPLLSADNAVRWTDEKVYEQAVLWAELFALAGNSDN